MRKLFFASLALAFLVAPACADDWDAMRPTYSAAPSYAAANLVAAASRYLGTNPTGRRSLWCADFANLILKRQGHRGTGSRLARDFTRYGRPAPRGCTNCIAVLTRGKRGGHVGFVKAWRGGNPVIVSGNHNRRVGVAEYSARRLIALRYP